MFVWIFITTLFSILIGLCVIFPFLTHPLAIGLTLLIMSLIIAAIIGTVYSSYYLPYCLVLILLGGLLVIFVYVSLLASNKTFQISKKGAALSLRAMIPGAVAVWHGDTYLGHISQITTLNVRADASRMTIFECLAPLYSTQLGGFTLFGILYLLLTLLVVVFNTKADRATLRSQNKLTN